MHPAHWHGEDLMETIGQVAELVVTPEWDRIRKKGGKGYQECNRLLRRLINLICQENGVNPDQFPSLSYSIRLKSGSRSLAQAVQRVIREWDPGP